MADRAGRVNAIVVGVDGSPSSIAALDWALTEAAVHAATVRAVAAWMPAPATVSAGLPRVGDVAPEETASRALDIVLHDAGVHDSSADTANGAVKVERHVVAGSAAKVLIDLSADADLLVVGSRGIGGFAGLMLGSVSQQVAQHAYCPVVVVRPPEVTGRGATEV